MVEMLGVMPAPAEMLGVLPSWAPTDAYAGDSAIGRAVGDFGFYAQQDATMFRESCPLVRVLFVDRAATQFDGVYNEAPDGVVYQDEILEIHAMLTSGGEEAAITELGLDKNSSVTITFSNQLLQQAGKAISLGDLVAHAGKTYQVVQVNQKNYLAGLDWPLHTVCLAKVFLAPAPQEPPTEQDVPLHKATGVEWTTGKDEARAPVTPRATLDEVLEQEG